MRVGIDICRLTDARTGVGNYIVNLLDGLAAVDKDTTYLLYPYFGECFAKPVKELQKYVPAQPNFRLYGRLRPEIWVKLWWFGLKVPQERLLGRVDVTHSTNLAGFGLRKSKLAVTVHDLSFLREPAWHKAGNVTFSTNALAGAVRHADALIAPSRFTAEELVRFYPEAAGRVRVVPEAVSAGFSAQLKSASLQSVRAKYGLARPYFLFVGTVEPRKNVAKLARAFHRFLAAGFKEYELVIAGGTGWKAQEALSALNDPAGQGLIRHLGYVPDEDLPALYQAALAFIYPSLYEGFGLPVLEALSCGLPVITSQDTSMVEIAGEAGWYVNPAEEEELTAAMARLADDARLRESLSTAGPARAALFSLAEMGRRTLSVYRELAG